MLREIEVSLPPLIADLQVVIPGEITARLEEATREIVKLDSAHPDELGSLGAMLLRTESVASSKIEHIDAPIDDFARALGGSKENPTAATMVAATEALEALISSVTLGRNLKVRDLEEAHAVLMRGDPDEAPHAGRLRTVQNWIGGSDHSPRNADYIPPPPELVPELMDDLMRFSNREDIPALLQASLAHAQLESIHPFTDGNGRIGRGLIHTILRMRGVTSTVVIPLASALVAHRSSYFRMLDSYRSGDIIPILDGLAIATRIAASESQKTAQVLKDLPEEWRGRLGRVRRGSGTDRLLKALPTTPVFTAADALEWLNGSRSSVYEVLTRLTEHGIIKNLTNRRRNQIFGAPDILAELTDLDLRISSAAQFFI